MRAMGFLLALLPVFAAASSATVTVKSVQLAGDATHAELVLALSGSAEHTLFTLSQPNRIVLDVDDAELKAALPPGRGVVSALRSAAHDDKLRLVLDLNTRALPQSFLRQTASGPELVVEMTAPGATPLASMPAPASTPVPAAAIITAPAMPSHGRNIVVAIDAGHGGKDPGAHGPKGAYEKNVTLAVARKLAALVDRQPGMKAVLTRDSDVYVDLKERFMKARRANADLFVSIHCDAARDKSADGATVYVLSDHGATTEHAKAVADRENYGELVGGADIGDESLQLRSVLVDMSQSAVMGMSFEVGTSVAKQLDAIGAMHRNGVQQAGFMVLKAPDVPSMLIETNYITNPRTAKLLMSNDYQQQLASAIFTGIDNYFSHYPPPGSQLAVLKQRDSRTSSVLASGVGLSPQR